MKIEALFNLVTDAQDLLTFFEGVETTEQLVSRLERIKRASPEDKDDFLLNVQSLRASVRSLLNETFEMNTQPDFNEESEDDDDLGLGELEEIENVASDDVSPAESKDKSEE